jgi:hypothetical protein
VGATHPAPHTTGGGPGRGERAGAGGAGPGGPAQQASGDEALQRILAALPRPAVQRYQALRDRCLELRQIAAGIKGPAQETPRLEELQMSGLERLLWTFLRLLYTQHMLERFFIQTNEAQIKQTIENLETSLRRLANQPDDPQKEKIRRAVEDNLETSRSRLANLEKARDNAELIRHEIDRLENKIHSLSELAVNRQEPDFVTSQVDQIAASIVQTERTMNDLRFATGLTADEAVPQLIEREVIPVRG